MNSSPIIKDILERLDIDLAKMMMPEASSDRVILIALHKARYESINIASELRQESRKWLEINGYGRYKKQSFSSDGSLPE